MALAINELYINLSGGATNVDPNLSLGGVINTNADGRVTSQTTTAPSFITGVVIDDAYGNDVGVGTLSYTASTTTLSWKGFNEPNFFGQNVGAGGTFTIGTSSGYLVVTVDQNSLPASNQTDSITVNNEFNNLYPNVSEAVSLIGQIDYRCVYIYNTNSIDPAVDVKLWIVNNTTAEDDLAIGIGTAGINATEQTIADSNTPPVGVTFTQPTSFGAALDFGTISASSYYAFWIRRTVTAGSRGTVINNSATFAISATV